MFIESSLIYRDINAVLLQSLSLDYSLFLNKKFISGVIIGKLRHSRSAQTVSPAAHLTRVTVCDLSSGLYRSCVDVFRLLIECD